MLASNALPNNIHDFQPFRNTQAEYWGNLGFHWEVYRTLAFRIQAMGSL